MHLVEGALHPPAERLRFRGPQGCEIMLDDPHEPLRVSLQQGDRVVPDSLGVHEDMLQPPYRGRELVRRELEERTFDAKLVYAREDDGTSASPGGGEQGVALRSEQELSEVAFEGGQS